MYTITTISNFFFCTMQVWKAREGFRLWLCGGKREVRVNQPAQPHKTSEATMGTTHGARVDGDYFQQFRLRRMAHMGAQDKNTPVIYLQSSYFSEGFLGTYTKPLQ